MAWFAGYSPRHAGVALLRDMVMQPKRTQVHTGSNLVAFDSAGATLYGLNTETSEFGLRRIQVLADGLAEQLVVSAATSYGTRSLSFANDRVVAGRALYDAPALTAAGVISTASDCWPKPSGTQLLCFGDYSSSAGRLLIADSSTFVIGGTLVYAASEPNSPRRLVRGPAGQVAISYGSYFAPPAIRFFSSPQLP
jgi:hypothetical protein